MSSPWALLEVLVVLPEEVNSRHLRLGANRREEAIAALRTSVPNVLNFLSVCILGSRLSPLGVVVSRQISPCQSSATDMLNLIFFLSVCLSVKRRKSRHQSSFVVALHTRSIQTC